MLYAIARMDKIEAGDHIRILAGTGRGKSFIVTAIDGSGSFHVRRLYWPEAIYRAIARWMADWDRRFAERARCR